jgi:hypothetical protein
MRLSRFPRLLAAFVALAVPASLAVGSCGLVLDDFQKVAAPMDAGSDVDAAPLGCQSISYPDPPEGAPDNPSDAIEFTGAVRTIDLGEGGDKTNPVGLNLDKFCTCLGEGPSCKDPPFATKEDHCDDKGGVDNAASRLFAALGLALPVDKFGSAFYSNKAEEGFWTLLLRVTGYNGELDDPRVTVAIYGPAGLQASSKSGMGSTDGGGGAGASDPCQTDPDAGPIVETIPCWNGHDVWRVGETSVGPSKSVDEPLYFDENAYVSKGTLVASVTETTLSLGGATSYLGIKLTAGTIVGAIQAPQVDGLGFRIVNGTLAARWKTADIFQTLSTFSSDGENLCKDDEPVYSLFKERVCGFVDISSTLGGATLVCDSISFGMRFSTFPVKLGDIGPVLGKTTTCPAEFDPANDKCGM